MESRRINKDVSSEEIDSLWQKIKSSAFDIAKDELQKLMTKAQTLGHEKDAKELQDHLELMDKVMESPTEKVEES